MKGSLVVKKVVSLYTRCQGSVRNHCLPEDSLFGRTQLVIAGREEIAEDFPFALDTEISDLLQSILHHDDFLYAAEGSGIRPHQGVG